MIYEVSGSSRRLERYTFRQYGFMPRDMYEAARLLPHFIFAAEVSFLWKSGTDGAKMLKLIYKYVGSRGNRHERGIQTLS